MHDDDVFVCESTGLWAARLRRCDELWASRQRSRPRLLRVQFATDLQQCRAWLDNNPAGVVVVELRPDNVSPALDFIWNVHRDCRMALSAAVAERSLEEFRWLAMELGAAALFSSPRDLTPLALLARRHREERPDLPDDPLARVWAQLPWPESAGTS
ncbi:MAG: hypothetical protein HYS13_07600 [Planctomycetia bacterium]|nr:hypothetical protein [Planctomycetia bacterium]